MGKGKFWKNIIKKKFSSFLILMVILTFGCGNGKRNQVESGVSVEKNGAAKIEFRSEMHNFGTLKVGETVSFSFIYKNSGNIPFKIKDIIRSCDCITAKYEDTAVSPGKESEIEVILNTAGEWGNLLKTLEVHTSAGEKKILTVNAYIENEPINNFLKNPR